MSYRMPVIRRTKGHSSVRSSLLSPCVSRRTLMGYPSYARNCACALPSPSPFHYLMAKIAPAVQLAMRTKSSTSYRRLYGRKSKFFRLDRLLLFVQKWSYAARAASSAIIRYLYMTTYHLYGVTLNDSQKRNYQDASTEISYYSTPIKQRDTWQR